LIKRGNLKKAGNRIVYPDVIRVESHKIVPKGTNSGSRRGRNKMKKNRTIPIALGVITLFMLLSSCAGPATIEVTLDCDAFAAMPSQVDRIEVGQGDAFTITLCSNPTTGYSWGEDADISDTDAVRQDHQEFNPGQEDPSLVGAPGTHAWTFTAIQTGESVITLAYGQSWEGGEKDAWTFTLTVVVK
jgi:inhibitor of cysteine peptidase